MFGTDVVKFIINRIFEFRFDNLSDMFTELSEMRTTDEVGNDHLVNVDDWHWADRSYMYAEMWRVTLNELYKRFLPEIEFKSDWIIELTPYTILLCDLLLEDEANSKTLEKPIMQGFATVDNLLEKNEEMFIKLKIPITSFSPALEKLLPNDPYQRQKLILRLMNFPPLRALSLFYKSVHEKYTKGLNELMDIFAPISKVDFPSFGVTEPFMLSVLYFNHKLFEKYGLDWFEKQPELSIHKQAFASIRLDASRMEGKFSGTVVCSCCGEVFTTSVPVGILHYKLVFEYDELAKDISYLLFNEIKEEFRNELARKFAYVIENLNPKENADVLILVEGSSEEVGLPVLAFKRRLMFKNLNVQVYNSGSKEQLARDFKAFKKQMQHLKIICLLDSDAKKEKAELERLMKGHKDSYDLVFIEEGTWEDIFSLHKSIDILNEMYPEGDAILASDFPVGVDFVKSADKILWSKKQAKFDKVRFSRNICWGMEASELPDVVNQILNLVEKFMPDKDNIFGKSKAKVNE